MSERTFLFLLSLAVFVGAIGVAAWLMVTNQVGTVDGLFLFCSSLVAAFAFGLLFALDGPIGHAHRASRFVIRTP
jgi:hypothetical protein